MSTHFTGPVMAGPRAGETGALNTPGAVGNSQLVLSALLGQNGTNSVSVTFTIPKHSQIIDFVVHQLVQWDSGTSAGLTVGTAAAGTQYVSSFNVKTTGVGLVALPALTLAQMTAMGDTGTNQSVVVTVAVSGATTVGSTRVTMRYLQTELWNTN